MQLMSGTLNISNWYFSNILMYPHGQFLLACMVTASTSTFVMCIVISPLIHKKSVLFKYRLIAKGILDPNCVAPSALT